MSTKKQTKTRLNLPRRQTGGGQGKKYHLRVFGCQMNKSDAERVEAVMQKAGYSPTDDEKQADVIIAVACSVRQSAVDRVYGLSGRWRKLKVKNQESKKSRKQMPMLILTGCVLGFDKKKLGGRFDVILPITKIGRLPKLIIDHRTLNINDTNKCEYLNILPKRKSKFQAYVPIMTGCESFCTYCVVPYVRGKEIFRDKKEIVAEVRGLIKDGYKEITLLGENVNNYCMKIQEYPSTKLGTGKNIKITTDFPALLQTLAKIPGKFWLRFVTSNPENFSDELIKVIASEPVICNHVHVPFQAGSDAILKKMNRKYTKSEYLTLIKKIKKAMPDVALSTDVIVGFPGETKKQFEETARVMRKVKFDMAYIAQYSPRPGTAAAKFEDDVGREEKKRRERVLSVVLQKTALANNRRLIGKVMQVLVCNEVNKVNKVNRVNNFLIGKTEGFKNVRFVGDKKLVGEFVKVRIMKTTAWGLEGELIK